MEFGQKPRLDIRVEISPLIDVVFLLLIFFMVTTTFVEEAALDIQLPEAGSKAERPDAPIDLAVHADGVVYVDGERVEQDRLKQAIRETIERNPDRTIVIKGDARAPHGVMVRVYDAVNAAGGRSFMLDAVPEGEAGSPQP